MRWYEVIPAALHGVPPGRVRVELPANMPEVDADAGMLERVIANIVENAVKYAPDSDIVVVGAAGGLSPATLRGRPAGELRIIDHGQGVPAERVLDMFRPFQRLDDDAAGHRRRARPGRGEGIHRGDGRNGWRQRRRRAGGLTMVITLPLSTGVALRCHLPAQAPLEPQSALTGRRHQPPLAVTGQETTRTQAGQL